MLHLSNFDLIDMDPIYNKLFRFSETKAFNQIFEEAGYESSNFILLIGPLFLIVILYPLRLIILKAIMSKKFKKLKVRKYLTKKRDEQSIIYMFF